MALPIINTPTFELTIPSTQKKIKYRPFLVKEEKALLIAQQSTDEKTMVNTLKSIISSCTFDGVNVDKLAMFDIEYIFCQLRAASVGELVDITMKCGNCEDGKLRLSLDLSKIEVEIPKEHTSNIKLFGDVGIRMKYPDFEMMTRLQNLNNNVESLFEIIVNCIDMIYDSDEVYPASEQTRNDLMSFIENLTQDQFEKIQEFFNTMPALQKTVEFDCPSCGHHNKSVVRGLNSFFS